MKRATALTALIGLGLALVMGCLFTLLFDVEMGAGVGAGTLGGWFSADLIRWLKPTRSRAAGYPPVRGIK